jgi:hypothetical protein
VSNSYGGDGSGCTKHGESIQVKQVVLHCVGLEVQLSIVHACMYVMHVVNIHKSDGALEAVIEQSLMHVLWFYIL